MNVSPFFIMATPRSGTTLLERLLNSHPELFIPPETVFFYKLKQYGILNEKFNFSRTVGFIKEYIKSRPAILLGLTENEIEILINGASSYRDVFENLMGFLSVDPEKKFWGEKTPHHLHCVEYITSIYADAKIIFLVRDGRAVVASHVNQPEWSNNYILAAQYWSKDSRLIQVMSEKKASNILLIKYEDLILDTEHELIKVCNFIGVKFDPIMLDKKSGFANRFSDYYKQPWMSKSVESIDESRINSWQDDYTAKKLALVEYIMKKDLEAFSYSLVTPGSFSVSISWAAEWILCQCYRIKRYSLRKLYNF